MRRMMVTLALVAVAATVPAGAEVLEERGSVSVVGGWIPPTPGVPERAPWSIVLAGTNELDACAGSCPRGRMTVLTEDENVQGTVSCLRVAGNESYLEVTVGKGHWGVPWAVYAKDATGDLEAGPDVLMLMRGRTFDCNDPSVIEELRAAAVPLVPGDVAIVDPCRVAVCPAGL